MPRNGLYRTLWRTPRVRGQALFGFLAQITQGAAPISLVLVVHQATGSLAAAGVVSGALWIAAAVMRPIQGRLIDRRGSRFVMLACGPLHAAALIGLVGAARSGIGGGAGVWWLVLLSILAGSGLPPVSATMRVEWGRRLPADERTAAYSLVYLTQEIALLTGPLLVAGVVAIGSAGLALIVAASISGGAAIAYGVLSEAGTETHAPVRPGYARSTAMPALLGVSFLLGSMLGVFQVATPALALARGVPAIGGVLIGALSVGGIVGALLYGGQRWSIDSSWRLLGLLCVVGIAATPLAVLPAMPVVGVLLAFVGAAVNPAFTTTSLLVDRHSSARAAEAFGWMSTAVGGGTAAGSATAGALAQHYGFSLAFLAAAIAAYAAVLLAALTRGRLRRDPAEPNLASMASRV